MRVLWSVMGICLLSAIPAGAAENLLEDGASFEVGFDGFNLNNQYLFSHRGREIEAVFDDTTAVHGSYSLRLDNPLLDKIYLTFRPSASGDRPAGDRIWFPQGTGHRFGSTHELALESGGTVGGESHRYLATLRFPC